VTGWARWVIQEGLEACEKLLGEGEGPFCFGATPTMADLCLIPQLGNAKRFGADISALTQIKAVAAACADHPAFIAAAPENQPDAE
jgi:maleylpyruvate isomerase